MLHSIFICALEVAVIVVVATSAFDVIHFMLHRFMRSRSRLLRALGALHQAHHDFLDEELVLHQRFARANLTRHLVPEVATQLAAATLCYAFFDPLAVAVAQALFLAAFVRVAWLGGRDRYHAPESGERAPTATFIVEPAYHALHHRFPDRYFSSCVQVFDVIAGTACPLRGRRVTLTGASGAFGAPLKALLETEGAIVQQLKFGVDWSYDDVDRPNDARDAILRATDILVLAHGSKVKDAMAANCTSFVALIDRYRALHAGPGVPEIWAVGSEIETHPAFGVRSLQIYLRSKRAFAAHARRYARDARLLYRHIVPSAFTSPMGRGLMSGRLAAAIALFLIKRGFRYVPVTYTGFAFVGFLRFIRSDA